MRAFRALILVSALVSGCGDSVTDTSAPVPGAEVTAGDVGVDVASGDAPADQGPLGDLSPVASTRHVVAVQERVRGIDVEESVTQYLTAVVRATRGEPKLRLGASPRAALILYRCCQALAFVRGRDYVVPDDVKELAGPVLAHRVVLDAKSRYAGVGMKGLIRDLVETVRVPA